MAATPEITKANERVADAQTIFINGDKERIDEVEGKSGDQGRGATTGALNVDEGQVCQCSSNAHSVPRHSFGEWSPSPIGCRIPSCHEWCGRVFLVPQAAEAVGESAPEITISHIIDRARAKFTGGKAGSGPVASGYELT